MRNGVSWGRLALVLSLLLGLGHGFAAPHPVYARTTYGEMVAWAINDAGVISGVVESGPEYLAVTWEIEQFVQLPHLHSGGSSAAGINSGGQIVGHSDSDTGEWLPVAWKDGEITPLSMLGAGPESGGFALGINDHGQIVGASWTRDYEEDKHAVIWQDGAITDLGCLPGDPRCVAIAINERGQIVGWSETPIGELRPVLWQDGTMTALGMLPGDPYGAAMDINDSGQIVGYSGISHFPDDHRPLRWQDGEPSALPDLPGGTGGTAWAINAAGQIVGSSEHADGKPRAVLWEHGQVTDLGVLPGDDESWALDINDHGQIVGSSRLDDDEHATLWQDGEIIALGGALAEDG
jgi:probable HAF family extracellular repeat protein